MRRSAGCWRSLLCWRGRRRRGAQNPYAPALTVNDGVITHYDIDAARRPARRARGERRPARARDRAADRGPGQGPGRPRRSGIELPEGAVEAGLEEFATARGLTVEQVLQVLDARGIDRQTLDDFVQSGLLWREVVGTRFRARATAERGRPRRGAGDRGHPPQEIVELAEIALPFAERGEAATRALAERLSRELARGGDFAARGARVQPQRHGGAGRRCSSRCRRAAAAGDPRPGAAARARPGDRADPDLGRASRS